MPGEPSKRFPDQNQSSVRFTDEALARPSMSIHDTSSGSTYFRGRPDTPAAHLAVDAYFPSMDEVNIPSQHDRNESSPKTSFPFDSGEISPRSQAAPQPPAKSDPKFTQSSHLVVSAPPAGSIQPSTQYTDPEPEHPKFSAQYPPSFNTYRPSYRLQPDMGSQPPSYPDRAYQSPSHYDTNQMAQAHATAFSNLENVHPANQKPGYSLMYDPVEGLEALQQERRRGTDETLVGLCDIEAGHKQPPRPSMATCLEISGVAGGSDPRHRNAQPLKPSLKRATTEDVVEREPARNAASIVGSHVQRRDGNIVGRSQRINYLDDLRDEDGEETPGTSTTKGGVLSHLLQLYGDSSLRRTERCGSAASGTTYVGESVATSRQNSNDSTVIRRKSTTIPAWATKELSPSREHFDEKIHPSPSQKTKGRSSEKPSHRRRKSHASDGGDSDNASVKSTYSVMTFRNVVGAVQDKIQNRKRKLRQRRASITIHVADILKRQNFILKLAKALMATGAPSHRLESQLSATARVLELDAQFVHLPSIVIATFGDCDTRTSETHFVKAAGGIALGQLHRVHEIYKSVIHHDFGVGEGSAALHKIMNEAPIYSTLQRMFIAFVCCAITSMLGFAGSFVDGWVSGVFGGFLAFMQLRAAHNQMYSNIFEISIATLVSFVSRALSTTNYFCYQSLSSAGVVLILPGYTILCGSLELASKHLIAGSVRMVYAVIYSLFLGFGISIGSDFYYLLDPNARKLAELNAMVPTYTLSGSFSGLNGTLPVMSGEFTLTNTTSTASDSMLSKGRVQCYRDPEWEWWRQGLNPLWIILLVPTFSFFLALWNLQPIWTKEMPVMVVIASIGWVFNYYANQFIFDRSDVVSFLGAFVIGLMGNMYSRIFGGTAFTSMATGVLFLVPSGIAAAGGLAMTYHSSTGDSYSNGLIIGFRMVQVAIGITVGLFFSSFVVYSVGRGKSGAAFTF